VDANRKSALITGVFFIISIVAAIPALALYGPVLSEPDYIVGAGADNGVFLGAFLEVITAIAIIGTAVTLFPILKRQNEGVALGYVAARVLEATVIVVGIISLLSVVTLRQDLAGGAGADAPSLVTAGNSLVAIHDWTFLLGPGLMPGVNALLLGYLMYRSGLVPRAMAMLALVGGPLLLASATATLFGLYEQISVPGFILTLPVFAWELSLGIYLIVKGFKPSPILAGHTRQVGADDRSPVPAAAAG
jgi:hypothetical protein